MRCAVANSGRKFVNSPVAATSHEPRTTNAPLPALTCSACQSQRLCNRQRPIRVRIAVCRPIADANKASRRHAMDRGIACGANCFSADEPNHRNDSTRKTSAAIAKVAAVRTRLRAPISMTVRPITEPATKLTTTDAALATSGQFRLTSLFPRCTVAPVMCAVNTWYTVMYPTISMKPAVNVNSSAIAPFISP